MDPNQHTKIIYCHKAINCGRTHFQISVKKEELTARWLASVKQEHRHFSKKVGHLGKHLIKVK